MDDTSTRFALYPLSSADSALGQINMVKEWLVEGLIDANKLQGALDRVARKWPLLAGRVVEVSNEKYAIRIPLGDQFPSNYHAYGFSISSSPLPLSNFLELPLQTLSKVPPSHLFVSDARAKLGNLKDYVEKQAPITHWHITHFKQPGEREHHTCVGIHYSHGVFDGLGFAMIIHAVQAELAGKEWNVPPLPHEGLNENRFITLMEEAATATSPPGPCPSFPIVGRLSLVWLKLKLMWTNWRDGVENWNFKIPHATHTKLVAKTREAMKDSAGGTVDGSDSVTRVSAGDVLAAWLAKTLFDDVKDPDGTVRVTSVASLRALWGGELSQYPHNCFAPLPLPKFTARTLSTLSLGEIAAQLAKARQSSRIPDAVSVHAAYERVVGRRDVYMLPHLPIDTRERLMISNVSVARVANIDWRGAGCGRTVCHWKARAIRRPVAGSTGVNGWLDNGDLVVCMAVGARRARALERAIDDLTRELASE